MSTCFGYATGQSARRTYTFNNAAIPGPEFGVQVNKDFSVRRGFDPTLISFLKGVVLALGCIVADAYLPAVQAESLEESVQSAAHLNDRGDFGASIRLLAPLLESQGTNNQAALGLGWNVYGLALQSMGKEDEARRSYERAIEILRKAPAEKANLAAALDNLGSLKAETGQVEESTALRIKSRVLYKGAGDFAGVGRTSINLALIALKQGQREVAHKLLTDARTAEAEIPTPDAGDLAALYDAQALECDAFKDPKDALILVDKAIQVWIAHYGSRYYLLATGYALRGQFETELNDRERATIDYEHSLDILRPRNGPTPRTYFLIEAAYAKALRKFGMREDAERMEKAAQSGLNSLRNPCPECTFSASGVR